MDEKQRQEHEDAELHFRFGRLVDLDARGECGATDGFSVCSEPAGHGPTHWDRRTQHEWSDRD